MPKNRERSIKKNGENRGEGMTKSDLNWGINDKLKLSRFFIHLSSFANDGELFKYLLDQGHAWSYRNNSVKHNLGFLKSFVCHKNAFCRRELVWSQNVEVKNRTLLDSLLVLSGQQKDTVEVHLTKIHQIFWEDVSLDWSTRTTTGHIMDTKWTSWGQALR